MRRKLTIPMVSKVVKSGLSVFQLQLLDNPDTADLLKQGIELARAIGDTKAEQKHTKLQAAVARVIIEAKKSRGDYVHTYSDGSTLTIKADMLSDAIATKEQLIAANEPVSSKPTAGA